ncbi:TetR/AcrR family transcriptional regulator [Microbulbifer sp. SAOS-129_SWC]|uniref:TetR/AcrR family transcriptional regulator n=1 Tax=Microbulbifer sp. SAOS-129_SWC TaxID=3145235 RepID=UPI003217EE17
MPRSKEHKARSCEAILAAAYRLFTTRGFERVTIDAVMADAGLTRGAFYNHFASKADLYREAFQYGADQQALGRAVVEGAPEAGELEEIVRHYLSPAHADSESGGCPLSFLNADAAVDRWEIRQLYSGAFEKVSAVLGEAMPQGAPARENAGAVMALMIGAVTVSRALTDPQRKRMLLQSCEQLALQLVAAPAAAES